MSNTIQFKGAELSYNITGNGIPVMLLHGFGEDSSVWDELLPALSLHARLIIPDINGSGRSEMLKGNAVSMSDYADAINTILDQEGISKVFMTGHSMGGYITLAFAEKYPEKLLGIGLFHSSAYADDEQKAEMRKKAIEFIKKNGTASFLETSTPGLFKDAEKSKEDIAALLLKGNSLKPEVLIQYYEAMIHRPDRTEVLRQIRKPVLFIMGEHDKAVPFEHSLQQSHLPRHSYVYILRNSAHMGMMEEKEQVIKILADVFDELSVNI